MGSRVRAWASNFETRWPGRVVVGTLRAMVRLEIFDRAMTLAAQLFTVFSIAGVVIITRIALLRLRSIWRSGGPVPHTR